jgi:hypothetical protein
MSPNPLTSCQYTDAFLESLSGFAVLPARIGLSAKSSPALIRSALGGIDLKVHPVHLNPRP